MFISFEGIDGCGKSTVSNTLYEYLKSKGIECVKTLEPGGTVVSQGCRDLLLNSKSLDNRAEVMLFLAARAQHVAELIKPAIESGKWVICDRYADSFYAYQAFGRGFDLKYLQNINDFACYGVYPDKTFFLDVDVKTGLSRQKDRDRISSESVDFFTKISNGFSTLADMYPERIVKIDANKPKEEVFARVLEVLGI